MSLARLVYYSAMVAGWAALLGWLAIEVLFAASFRDSSVGILDAAVIGGLAGAAIGLAINLVAGLTSGQWKQLLLRAVVGFLGGAVGGALGGLVGNLLYLFFFWLFNPPPFLAVLLRAIGWLVMGLAIGVVDGLYEQSPSKIRNGLIGGGLGGLLGGVLFDLLPWLLHQSVGLASGTGMSSRATGFIVLGISIGAMIGLAQVVLRDAWLTVVDGYRTGRQLILSQAVTALGRGDHLPLPFLGPSNKDLEAEHLKIIREPSGAFVLEDNNSRLGTYVNKQRVQGRVPLKDGAIIKFGTNIVRFNERQRKGGGQGPPVIAAAQPPVRAAPPPPVRRSTAAPPAKPQAGPPPPPPRRRP